MPEDSTSTDLLIDIEHGAERLDVTIRGELDAHSAVAFEQQATDALTAQDRVQTMVLDLGGITFIDSSGLRSLLRLQESCDERGGILFVRQPSDVVSRIIDLAKLGGRFPTEPS
jgi:stage II sporulation protein AA (anti-sigma F factor antagonist)